ncbi:MAG TPA: DUF1566 domain-containing protein [bacterium]|nr:DUF1566 domain-containing protein [bacterium]HPN31627.1 DUF1566 domain-containing protein [bacterium]
MLIGRLKILIMLCMFSSLVFQISVFAGDIRNIAGNFTLEELRGYLKSIEDKHISSDPFNMNKNSVEVYLQHLIIPQHRHEFENTDLSFTDKTAGLMWANNFSPANLTDEAKNLIEKAAIINEKYFKKAQKKPKSAINYKTYIPEEIQKLREINVIDTKLLDAMNNSKYAGFDDWRLPTIDEICSLYYNDNKKIEFQNSDMKLDKNFVFLTADMKTFEEEKLKKASSFALNPSSNHNIIDKNWIVGFKDRWMFFYYIGVFQPFVIFKKDEGDFRGWDGGGGYISDRNLEKIRDFNKTYGDYAYIMNTLHEKFLLQYLMIMPVRKINNPK